jgi:hypothetical protein
MLSNRRDLDAWAALLGPDVEWRSSTELPGIREVYRGLRSYFRRDPGENGQREFLGWLWNELWRVRALGGSSMPSFMSDDGHRYDRPRPY